AAGLGEAADVPAVTISRVGEGAAASGVESGETESVAADRHTPRLDELVVVDLSSLWAGPLCAHLLGLGGTQVIKVESWQRPDGARRGPKRFYDLLHGGHQSVAFDFDDPDQRRALRELVEHADVVIEASRPRALRALGIDRERIMATTDRGHGPRVWLSITAHGRSDDQSRIGFGDDAAVGGGL
ncbi:MAG TPA: CoA transferase, partial [Ilumatobacteraceae bacterium]|nr:CoA transferase [Ilumatobacteraceae bacterium]